MEREESIRAREKAMAAIESKLSQAEQSLANQQQMFNAKIDTKQQFITALKEQTEEVTTLLDAQTQLANKHRVEARYSSSSSSLLLLSPLSPLSAVWVLLDNTSHFCSLS